MDTHKRILGTIYLIYGSFIFVLLFLVYFVLFGLIIGGEYNYSISDREASLAFTIVRWVFGFVLLIFVIPSIIGGIGLLNNKKWAMTLLVIVGFISLFCFPIGTALGAYTLWMFFKEQELAKAAIEGGKDFEKRSS